MSSQPAIELILLRQLASHLTIPIWMIDEAGSLLYYNEPAENLIGARLEHDGPVRADHWNETFETTDLEGRPIQNSEIPLVKTLVDHSPAHRQIRFRSLDGILREIEMSAMPLEGQGGRFLGVLATFWKILS